MFTPGALFFKLVYLPLLYLTERFRNAMKVKKNTPPLNLGEAGRGKGTKAPLWWLCPHNHRPALYSCPDNIPSVLTNNKSSNTNTPQKTRLH